MMSFVRLVSGKVVVFLDHATSPKGVVRDSALQTKVNASAKDLTLYQLITCPFCIIVRRELKRQAVTIETKNITEQKFQDELIAGGKIDQVPCLQIRENGSVQWLYESKAINQYLKDRFQAVSL